MYKRLKPLFLLLLVGVVYLMSVANYQWADALAYHHPQETNFLRGNNIETPQADNDYFKASRNCDGYHGFDSTFAAIVDGELNDVSPATHWRNSMMVNAAKDPHWRTQVSFAVFGQNVSYEPHYNVINAANQVQICEMVMDDVNGDVTTVLERAVAPIKDNRLVPLGFTTPHPTYDTTFIAGMALNDTDFNFDGFEGSGTDIVPLNGYTGKTDVSARVYYQPVPPKWVEELFTVSTPEIDAFEVMCNNADKTPVLVVADSIAGINVSNGRNEIMDRKLEAYPNLTKNNLIRLRGKNLENVSQIEAFSLDGKRISSLSSYSNRANTPGIYLRKLRSDDTETIICVYRSE